MSDYLRDRVIVAAGERYDIESEIGRGSMGVVYRATDIRLRRPVALKVLPPDLAFREGVRTRFLREAEMAAKLMHPNIVPIYSVDEHEGLVYFVMALVDGESLARRLEREPRPPLDVVRRVLHDVADALAFAHSRGVVHRDIKPDNILLDRYSGRPIVTDFGIARAAEADSRLTVTGVAVGTPAYMSPEQALGEHETDGRSDIYSLGVVGYQLVAGELPFKASNTPAMLMKHVSETPLSLAHLRPGAPSGLVSAIERALAKKPDERWSDAAAMRDAVTRVEAALPARAAPEPAARPASSSLRPERAPLAPSATTFPEPPPPLFPPAPISRREAKRLRREEKKKRNSVEAFAAKPLEERIRVFRREFFGVSLGLGAFTVVNIVSWPFMWWTVFPAFFMSASVVGKLASLWADGVTWRQIFGNARPASLGGSSAPSKSHAPDELAKLIPPDVLKGPHSAAVRRAVEDRAQIQMILSTLAEPDRELLPDVVPTVDALVQRTAALARMLHSLDADVEPGTIEKLDARIAEVEREKPEATDHERRMSLLRRQRGMLRDLSERRARVATQLESASIALHNLRLDLLKLRSSGVQAAIHDVTSATQEARALSREIGHVLDAAEEVRRL